MSFELPGASVLDDLPCHYGASKLPCRGPSRALDAPYLAFLGSSETYGKFVWQPFPALVECALSKPCINLGSVNAGLDSYVYDADLMNIARNADLTVIQVFGAQNLSNKYYRVHPRRNDRFLAASQQLSSIYSDVDFTEFHFNKHLLSTLHRLSPERFAAVREELRRAWLVRMRLLLQAVGKNTLLLWLRFSGEPEQRASARLGPNPLLVDRQMIDALRPDVQGVIEVPVVPAAKAKELGNMHFGAMQAPAAEHMLGPAMHRRIAERLLEGFLG